MPGFGMEWPFLKSSTPSLKRASERRPGALQSLWVNHWLQTEDTQPWLQVCDRNLLDRFWISPFVSGNASLWQLGRPRESLRCFQPWSFQGSHGRLVTTVSWGGIPDLKKIITNSRKHGSGWHRRIEGPSSWWSWTLMVEPTVFPQILPILCSAFHEFCRPYIVVFVKKPLVIKEKGWEGRNPEVLVSICGTWLWCGATSWRAIHHTASSPWGVTL